MNIGDALEQKDRAFQGSLQDHSDERQGNDWNGTVDKSKMRNEPPKKEINLPATMYKRNAGAMLKMRIIARSKRFAGFTMKCLEIPHYAYTQR